MAATRQDARPQAQITTSPVGPDAPAIATVWQIDKKDFRKLVAALLSLAAAAGGGLATYV